MVVLHPFWVRNEMPGQSAVLTSKRHIVAKTHICYRARGMFVLLVKTIPPGESFGDKTRGLVLA